MMVGVGENMTIEATEIEALEEQILQLKKRRAALKRAEPRERVEDFVFESTDGLIKLSELFAGRPDLLVIHNMGRSCSYCSLWADGFNGVVPHLESRAAFVVVSPDPVEVQREFAASRGWRFRMVRDADARFSKAMKMYGEDGFWPGATGFHRRENGTIEKIASAGLGEGDDFCAVWHLFDLLADGWAGWEPK